MKGQKSGSLHPNYKHGRYVGAKAKRNKKPTPQPGAAKAVRKTVMELSEKTFTSENVISRLPAFSAQQILSALLGLRRRGVIRLTGAWVGRFALQELVK